MKNVKMTLSSSSTFVLLDGCRFAKEQKDGYLNLSSAMAWRHHYVNENYPGHGTLEVKDMLEQIEITGDKTLVFDLDKENSKFGYREGKLIYENKENKVRVNIIEYYDFDEY